MKNKTAQNILIAVIALFFVALAFANAGQAIWGQKANVPTPSPQVVIVEKTVAASGSATTYKEWSEFKNPTAGYIVEMPDDWKNSSDVNGQAIFHPQENAKKLGSFHEISFTFVTKPKTNQILSTQKEFDEWYNQDPQSSSSAKLQKIDNDRVNGEKAVTLVDLRGNQDNWSMVTWTRHGTDNYYINAQGKGDFSQEDQEIYQHLLSTFVFTSPK